MRPGITLEFGVRGVRGLVGLPCPLIDALECAPIQVFLEGGADKEVFGTGYSLLCRKFAL